MQATFTLTLEHPTNETIALSNSEIIVRLRLIITTQYQNDDEQFLSF